MLFEKGDQRILESFAELKITPKEANEKCPGLA